MSNSDEMAFIVKKPIGVVDENTIVAIQYSVQYSINNLEYSNIAIGKVFRSPEFRIGNCEEFDAHIVFFPKRCCTVKNCKYPQSNMYPSGTHGHWCTFIEMVPRIEGQKCPEGKAQFSFVIKESKQASSFQANINESSKIYLGTKLYFGKCGILSHISSKTVCFTITCEITIDVKITLVGSENLPSSKTAQGQLQEDVGALMRNTDLSDLTLIADEKEFKAHKLILSARSPVFAKMFQTEMSESKLNVVEISDMTVEVLQSLLVYMYTDNVLNIDKLAEGLLSAAEKYQLDGLKEKCEEALRKSLAVENAAQIFMLADLHRAVKLKAKAVDYIKKNRDKVSETEGWKLAKEEHPLLLAKDFL